MLNSEKTLSCEELCVTVEDVYMKKLIERVDNLEKEVVGFEDRLLVLRVQLDTEIQMAISNAIAIAQLKK